jgi:hypothetical protein
MASVKVPIDARKILKAGEFIEIRFQDRVAKIPAWDWETKEPISLKKLSRLRICFYGIGVIEPWNQCKNYDPMYSNDLTFCKIKEVCEFSNWCPKFQNMISYIV